MTDALVRGEGGRGMQANPAFLSPALAVQAFVQPALEGLGGRIGALVCRWTLNRLHGAYGYEDAARRYGDFDRLIDPDPETRALLAKVIRGTVAAGQPAYVTVNNKAEGCAPLTVRELAREIGAGASR